MKNVGVVTIGQSPRKDVTPILEKHIGNDVNLIQTGVLNGLTKGDIEKKLSPQEKEYVLTTRLLSGDSVILGREKVKPILQQRLNELEQQGCRQIVLLCTGVFPGLHTKEAFLIEPDQVIPPAVAALVGERKFGLVVPLADQKKHLADKWSRFSLSPVCVDVSPYRFDHSRLQQVADYMKDQDVEVILMDCMGYVEEMRQALLNLTGIPVILSNALIAKVTSEITA